MALVDRMVQLNARLTSIPIRFGVPQYRPVLVRHLSLDAGLNTVEADTLLEPLPYVENVSPRLVSSEFGMNLKLREDDYKVSNIPRTYSADFFTQNVEFFAIDVTQDDSDNVIYDECNNPKDATLCKLAHLDSKELLTWTLILRKIRDGVDASQVDVIW